MLLLVVVMEGRNVTDFNETHIQKANDPIVSNVGGNTMGPVNDLQQENALIPMERIEHLVCRAPADADNSSGDVGEATDDNDGGSNGDEFSIFSGQKLRIVVKLGH